jgi:hypothetical protein
MPGRTAYTSPLRVPTNSVPLAPIAIERALGTSAYISIWKPGGSRIAERSGEDVHPVPPKKRRVEATTEKDKPKAATAFLFQAMEIRGIQ